MTGKLFFLRKTFRQIAIIFNLFSYYLLGGRGVSFSFRKIQFGEIKKLKKQNLNLLQSYDSRVVLEMNFLSFLFA